MPHPANDDPAPGAAPLTQAEAEARLIRRADMVPSTLAFIDCRMPRSGGKENYSYIGPGVTQSAEQVVNIAEPHGFSLGAAALPPGVVNNLHLHFTAEVFWVQSGEWTFRWGARGERETRGGPGDVLSMPTWIFRGFENVGTEKGFVYTALGGDDTGGIIWHPTVVRTAVDHGLHLRRDGVMVDTTTGAAPPAPGEAVEPLDDATLDSLRDWSDADMAGRIARAADRRFSRHGLLDSAAGLPGQASAIAPCLGHGMSQDRDALPPIPGATGFSLEWLRVEPGNRAGPYRLSEKQALCVFSGTAEVALNAPGGEVRLAAGPGEIVSVPPDAWRSVAATGPEPVEVVVVTAGDHRKRPRLHPSLYRAAQEAGWGLDHDGRVAPVRLLPPAAVAAE